MKPRRCGSVCAKAAVEGRRFCAHHQQQLDRIREQWETEESARPNWLSKSIGRKRG